MHQAFKEEPAANVKCKDKFLILSTFITEQTANMNLNELVSHPFLSISKLVVTFNSGHMLKKKIKAISTNTNYVVYMEKLLLLLPKP